jgi:CRP-like cAMP-binding protein
MTSEIGNVEAAPLQLLIRKLESYTELSEEESHALHSAAGPLRSCGSHEDVLREGERSNTVAVLVAGSACRHKVLPDGRRQIIGYLVPGDMCGASAFILKSTDHTVSTSSPSLITRLHHRSLQEITTRHPRLIRTLWWNMLVEQAMTREWLVNVGQRTALERVAHLLCEIYLRLRAVGLATPDGCELPINQAEIADAVALSTVHVNRTLKELRNAGLASLSGKSLLIHDFHQLCTVAMFDPAYLHLRGEGEIKDR